MSEISLKPIQAFRRYHGHTHNTCFVVPKYIGLLAYPIIYSTIVNIKMHIDSGCTQNIPLEEAFLVNFIEKAHRTT